MIVRSNTTAPLQIIAYTVIKRNKDCNGNDREIKKPEGKGIKPYVLEVPVSNGVESSVDSLETGGNGSAKPPTS